MSVVLGWGGDKERKMRRLPAKEAWVGVPQAASR